MEKCSHLAVGERTVVRISLTQRSRREKKEKDKKGTIDAAPARHVCCIPFRVSGCFSCWLR